MNKDHVPNNNVIDSLLEGQKNNNYLKDIKEELGDKQEASFARILTAKYKIYVIVILVIGLLLGINVLPMLQNKNQHVEQLLMNSTHTIEKIDQEIDNFQQKKVLLFNIEKYESAIISCINQNTNCEDLPVDISDKMATATAFLQLGTLNSDKMSINEKKILKNLDQYLIKKSPNLQNSSRNGQILSIHIGEEQVSTFSKEMYSLPIKVSISFDNKNDLISFVENIEKSIILAPEDRILYEIVEINYDMMAYDQKQESTIALLAHYFN